MTSAAFFPKSGASDAIHRTSRCGRKFARVRARCTIVCLTPRCFPNRRVLQCVEPSGGGVRVTAKIFASNSRVRTVGGFPFALREVSAGKRPSQSGFTLGATLAVAEANTPFRYPARAAAFHQAR